MTDQQTQQDPANMILASGKTLCMVPPIALSLPQEPGDESGPTCPFVLDTGPQTFEVDALDADISDLPFQAENVNETDYTKRIRYGIDRPQETESQLATGADGVLNLSEKFKQDYVW